MNKLEVYKGFTLLLTLFALQISGFWLIDKFEWLSKDSIYLLGWISGGLYLTIAWVLTEFNKK